VVFTQYAGDWSDLSFDPNPCANCHQVGNGNHVDGKLDLYPDLLWDEQSGTCAGSCHSSYGLRDWYNPQ